MPRYNPAVEAYIDGTGKETLASVVAALKKEKGEQLQLHPGIGYSCSALFNIFNACLTEVRGDLLSVLAAATGSAAVPAACVLLHIAWPSCHAPAG